MLTGITPVLALPCVETARNFILDVGTNDFNSRNRYVSKPVLEITDGLWCAKVVSLIVKNASVDVAAIFLVCSFPPGAFIGEHLFNLRALLIRDIHIFRSRLWPRIPRTHIPLRHPIANEDPVGLHKGVHILRFIGIVSPDAQTLTSLSSPLMLDTESIRPIRKLNRVLTVSFGFGPINRRYSTLQLLIIKVNPLSVYLDASQSFIPFIERRNIVHPI